MKGCPECGKLYPDEFLYCPVHGTTLAGDPEKKPGEKPPSQIPIRTLVIGLVILAAFAVAGFSTAFLYQYFKPKYGALTIRTTPDEALVYVDGKALGASPLNIPRLKSGAHEIRIRKEGYNDLVEQIRVAPYAEDTRHWTLAPVVPRLSEEQLAEIAGLSEKLKLAQKENILLPPPEDYNVLYFADKILAIDPADSGAIAAREQVADSLRRQAELAYARENWAESAKQYERLALLYPDDDSIEAILEDVSDRIAASAKDREELIENWRARAEAAMKVGSLTPPDKDNALDAIRNIQRIDKNNAYARSALSRLREQLQDRGDVKIAAQDWAGARSDFQRLLQYFPEDKYGKTRLSELSAKLDEAAKRAEAAKTEQLSRQKIAALRQSALDLFGSKAYAKSIAAWNEYLKFEPKSDEAWFYIGASYQNEEQYDQAIANFEKCLELNPGHVLAHLNAGLLYNHTKNFKAAEEHFLKAKELGGADAYTPQRIDETLRNLRERARVDEMSKQAIYVEHRHTLSSCRGALYFSGEGVEFRTTETDHSFYEAYKGIREFNIEGGALTIRTAMNRRYNFRFLNQDDAARVRAWWAAIQK
ncbi:MAG: tetratricopeptide repeat protein [Acidobacteriota bacterium]|jgi:tetratricopeptide (TPR) repeat protein|nr:tetratricopeptide repeat protein [Acidobacteriota bacterium]